MHRSSLLASHRPDDQQARPVAGAEAVDQRGRLLIAGYAVKRLSASLSPRDRRESGRAVPRGAHRARSALSASRRESTVAGRAARETRGLLGRNGEAPSDRSLGASVYRPSPLVGNEREMAPGPGCFGEVRSGVEPRSCECAEALGGSRRAALNAGLGAMFAAQVGGILADRRSERDPRTGRPRSVVNRCRAASCWTPRNLHASVIEDASAHRQAPPGLPRDAVDDAGRHRPPPGTRTAPSRRR